MSVLICFDGSASAKRSLAVAAATFDRAPVVLLNVWNPPERVIADAFGVADQGDGPDYARLEAFIAQRAADVLSAGETLAAELGLEVTARVERNHSTVYQTILDVADEIEAPVIVTGTQGDTVVKDGLLGSVSNALLHHARRPVLVVPAESAHPVAVGSGGRRAV